MKYLRLLMLRHGQTVESLNYTFNGWTDVELAPEGRAQLDEAAAALRGLRLDAVYSSDLKRAVYGGEALARDRGLKLTVEPRFREVNFGLCEGLRFPEIKTRWPELAEDILRPEGGNFLFPEGEGAAVFRKRINDALTELVSRHPGGAVALVSHAGVGRAVLADVLHLSNALMWSLTQDFACLNVVDFQEDGGVRVKLINGFLGPKGYHQEGPGFDRLVRDARF
ncbi:MAG: histidine phosphatase family protein [Deltaproteobacteria bacterium]|jgi:broad specificity phosphatase PhoE|nr:histidine phosphatase family protein [Deltaproteobacteria bacterium]